MSNESLYHSKYLSKETKQNLKFNVKLDQLYKQIKAMKLKHCCTLDKATGHTEIANIKRLSISNRSVLTNEITFNMDDNISWSIHEYNIDDIIVNDDSIVLFETGSQKVTFEK